jgi:polyhydroxyalkanoate synthase subunit PhaE
MSATGSWAQQQFDELRDTWAESIQGWAQLMKDGPGHETMNPEALRAMFAPDRWIGGGAGACDAALRHVLEGPKYATLFDLDRQLLELQRLAAQRDRDVATFQSILMKGWNAAFERFSHDISSSKEKLPWTWRGMADRWLATVNDTMIDVHRSEAFVEAQRRMLRSASDHRLQERKIAEAWCNALHVPTRTEMDEVQHTVTDLRRQLRALQRAAPKPDAPRSAPVEKRAASSNARACARA